jgi:hypothetical protein
MSNFYRHHEKPGFFQANKKSDQLTKPCATPIRVLGEWARDHEPQ